MLKFFLGGLKNFVYEWKLLRFVLLIRDFDVCARSFVIKGNCAVL